MSETKKFIILAVVVIFSFSLGAGLMIIAYKKNFFDIKNYNRQISTKANESNDSDQSDSITLKPDVLLPGGKKDKIQTQEESDEFFGEDFFDSLFGEDIFDEIDNPFEHLRKMRERMLKKFHQGPQINKFDNWFSKRFGGGSVDEIEMKDLENSIRYEIKLEDVKKDELKIDIQNGHITIKGTQKSNSSDEGAKIFYQKSFQRTFPIPPGVDQKKAKIYQEKNKLIVEFPKKK
jgi:HSP20 family molecular chaperone IbpA